LRAAFWRRQLYSGPSRLGQTNGDRLLWRSGAMLAFPNVFHFLSHKLARLSTGRFAFALVLARSFNCFFFWHNKMVSPLKGCLDVNKKAAGVTSRRFVVSKEPVLSSALLTAALLTATLFFTLAPLTFTLLSLAILLLSTLLSGGGGFAQFVCSLLFVHDAFLIELGVWSFALRDSTFSIKSLWEAIWTETHNRGRG
jgi:hypothetical protein